MPAYGNGGNMNAKLYFESEKLVLHGGQTIDIPLSVAKLQTYLGADTIIETHITRDMLERAEKIRLSNALRGVFEADLVY